MTSKYDVLHMTKNRFTDMATMILVLRPLKGDPLGLFRRFLWRIVVQQLDRNTLVPAQERVTLRGSSISVGFDSVTHHEAASQGTRFSNDRRRCGRLFQDAEWR